MDNCPCKLSYRSPDKSLFRRSKTSFKVSKLHSIISFELCFAIIFSSRQFFSTHSNELFNKFFKIFPISFATREFHSRKESQTKFRMINFKIFSLLHPTTSTSPTWVRTTKAIKTSPSDQHEILQLNSSGLKGSFSMKIDYYGVRPSDANFLLLHPIPQQFAESQTVLIERTSIELRKRCWILRAARCRWFALWQQQQLISLLMLTSTGIFN